jgi:hypothetical protein
MTMTDMTMTRMMQPRQPAALLLLLLLLLCTQLMLVLRRGTMVLQARMRRMRLPVLAALQKVMCMMQQQDW